MADWEWMFTSEYGRDKMLRSEIEYLASASASASAHNARLSSQLARLQGSLESRLSALSAAFDAYVELGDVREQLGAYAETAALRREVAEAIEAMAAGRAASPVEVGDGSYWLPYAANAVVALVAGQPDHAAEDRARELSREADLFVVVTVGALGRGELVADRVPDLLVADEGLRPAQVALWSALVDGVYPSDSDLLAAVGDRWRPTLEAGDAAEWRGWVSDRSGAPDVLGDLRWVRDLLAGTVVPPPPAETPAEVPLGSFAREARPDDEVAPPPDPRQTLRTIAATMVAEGSDAERDLIARSRELRRRIEDPGSTAAVAGPADEPSQPVRGLVRAELARAIASGEVALRDTLVGWVRPGLRTAVDGIADAPRPAPEPEEVRTPAGALVVTATGPDRARYDQVLTTIEQTHHASPRPFRVAAALGAVAAVAAVVVAVTGTSTTLLVLLVLAAVVAGIVALVQLRQRSVARQERDADLAVLQRSVDSGVERLRLATTAHDEQSAAVGQLVREVRSALS